MFAQSHTAIALVDLIVIIAAASTLFVAIRNRKTLAAIVSPVGLMCIVMAIAIFGLYYLADFLAVAVVPEILTEDAARAMFDERHPNAAWLVGAYGIVLMMGGFLTASRRILTQHEDEQDQHQAEATPEIALAG
ncbi:MAG: hypothetical protein O7C63_03160 [Alphaproteobacteria bacterium]|nr:hypothetical protein [Alphaproteobacteria bacterium]